MIEDAGKETHGKRKNQNASAYQGNLKALLLGHAQSGTGPFKKIYSKVTFNELRNNAIYGCFGTIRVDDLRTAIQ